MSMRLKLPSLRIGARLGVTALLFLLPVGYLSWLLSAEQNVAVSFASQEADGARYLRGLLAIEAAADLAALDRAPLPAAALEALRTQPGRHRGRRRRRPGTARRRPRRGTRQAARSDRAGRRPFQPDPR
jgi:hypothetical protein